MATEPTPRPAPRRRARRALSSVPLRLLRKIIEDVAPSTLNGISEGYLSDDEAQVYEFVRTHYNRHGRFPDMVTLEERRIILPDAPETLDFYRDEFRNNVTIRQAADIMLTVQEAIANNDGEAVRRALSQPADFMGTSVGVRTMREYLPSLGERLDPRSGISHLTPYNVPVLDRYLGGIASADLSIIYGRPATGKTMLQLASVLAVAEAGEPVVLITKEMSESQIVHRLAALTLNIDPQAGIQRPLSTMAHRRFVDGLREQIPRRIMDNIIIPDATRIKTPADVFDVIRDVQPRIAALDGPYFLRPASGRFNTSREILEQTVREIKSGCGETDTGMLMTWQQNRTKAVGTEGMYGTDAISQDAATAVEIKSVRGNNSVKTGTITKNRHGPMDVTFGYTYEFKPTRLGVECEIPTQRSRRDERDGVDDNVRNEHQERAIRRARGQDDE